MLPANSVKCTHSAQVQSHSSEHRHQLKFPPWETWQPLTLLSENQFGGAFRQLSVNPSWHFLRQQFSPDWALPPPGGYWPFQYQHLLDSQRRQHPYPRAPRSLAEMPAYLSPAVPVLFLKDIKLFACLMTQTSHVMQCFIVSQVYSQILIP